jgi:ferredoxin
VVVNITDECISCGACEADCPNKAISEGQSSYVVNPELCTECVGSFPTQQCIQTCPVGAIVFDENRESREVLLERWRKLHPGETPKDA